MRKKEERNKLVGEIEGLSTSEINALLRLYRRKISKDLIIEPWQAKELFQLSKSLNKVLALLVNRQGQVEKVII
ncbi:MAG: GTPase HflX, partial [Candidatus Dadabacteria bacterium]